MKLLRNMVYRARNALLRPLMQQGAFAATQPLGQQQLKWTYRLWAQAGVALPDLHETGLQVHSQTDEDGILLFIFAVLGSGGRRCVEVCAGNGIECNTANLLINHGWHGLLVDGNEDRVRQGAAFYRRHPRTRIFPPVFAHSWITRDNVDDLLRVHGFSGEIELLSIDLDGVDYWIWDAIRVVDPRVVVVEYQDILGPERCWTVPYRDDFNAYDHPTTNGMPNFAGASLAAFTKLARKKGYRLVGANRYGFNAFFIKNGLGQRELPEVPVDTCFKHPKVHWGMKERFPTVQGLPWVEV